MRCKVPDGAFVPATKPAPYLINGRNGTQYRWSSTERGPATVLLGREAAYAFPRWATWRMSVSARTQRLLASDFMWVALGLILTVAAAWRVVATPGEIIQGDLGYPFASEFWTRRFTNAWDTSYGTVLVNVMRTYTYVPWGWIVQAFGLSPEVAGKFHWLSWHLLAFLAAYVGTRMSVGGELRRRHPVALRVGLVLTGLFWALNPWTLARWEQLGVHISAVLLPLLFGLVVAATRAPDTRARIQRALAAAATLAFAVSTSPHYMATGLLVGLGWFVFAAMTVQDRRRQIIVPAVAFVGAFAVFAAFIFVPFLVTAAAGSPTGPRYAEGTDVQPVLESGQSIINTLTLTGHTFFGPGLRPDPAALPGWRAVALLPAALIVLVLWRQPDQRRVLGYAAIIGGATACIQVASHSDATRAAYLAVVENAPLGWALREPDKLSGALALAYLPGLALTPATFARNAPRHVPAIAGIQTIVFGLLLTAYMLPGIHRMLWDHRTLSLVPERFPASFKTVPAEIDRRNSDGASRTLLAVWPLRFPEWSASSRVLHAIEALAVTTPYAADNSLIGDRLSELLEADAPNLVDTLRAHGVARILVPTGTSRGQQLAQRLARTQGLESEISEGYHEVFRTADPPFPWVYEAGPSGPGALAWKREGMQRLVIDLRPSGSQARRIVTHEYWDPLWVADLPNYDATIEASESGLLSVRIEAGASGRLVLTYGLHRALVAGHAITWGGLAAWMTWMLWQRWPRRGRTLR